MTGKFKLKSPLEAFTKCPSCRIGCFLTNDGFHVNCRYCGWHSMESYHDILFDAKYGLRRHVGSCA